MRRLDRAVTNKEEIEELIKECKVCRIGFNDNGMVYIVPVNFGFCFEGDDLIIYIHSGKLGRKMEILKKNPNVGVEMDARNQLKEGHMACDYSYYFASLIGNGTAYVLENLEDKKEGLKCLMSHLTEKKDYEFDTKWLNAVAVVKIIVEEYACKKHEV